MKLFSRVRITAKRVACIILFIVFLFVNAASAQVSAMDISTSDDAVISKGEKVYSGVTLEDDFEDDSVMVILTNEASLSGKVYAASDFSEIACSSVNDLTSTSSALIQAKLRGEDAAAVCGTDSVSSPFSYLYDIDTSTFNSVLCLKLSEPGKRNVLAAIKVLENRPDVKCAEPNYIFSIENASEEVVVQPTSLPRATTVNANDQYSYLQWGISKIQLPQAWEISTGGIAINVGVLDTGIDVFHPDLLQKVDTDRSRKILQGTVTKVPVTDTNGHGTHVAGIISANTNNGIGISGTAWYCKLVSLQVIEQSGNGYTDNVVQAINYAIEQEIPILNFSSTSVNHALALYEAIENYQGLFICIAGNNNRNIDTNEIYPASYGLSNILVVGASTSSDGRYSNSNYGTHVDLFAPGCDILSCFPVEMCAQDNCGGIGNGHYADGYHYISGTSMAAPFVTGVAVMILAEYPGTIPEDVISRITLSVDPVSTLSPYCATGGRLNAYRALHNHSYSYSAYDEVLHTCTCSCGYTKTESHTWSMMSRVVPLPSVRTCTKCGYSQNIL